MRAQIPELTIRPVVTDAEVEQMRLIRNHCRRWMTHDLRLISQVQQRAWWKGRPSSLRAFLYCVDEEPVGFGLLRHEQERWWATLGVLRRWRGRGIGTRIYDHLMSEAPEDLWIEVRSDNARSLRAAVRAGFVLIEMQEHISLLRAGKERL